MSKTRVAELGDKEAIKLFDEDPVKNFDVLRNRHVRSDVDLSYNAKITSLPEGLEVGGWFILNGCKSLRNLPEGLRVGNGLSLDYCASLTSLPEGLAVVNSLGLSGCTSLTSLPEDISVGGNIWLHDCAKLKVWLVKERKIEWLRRKVKGQIKGLIEMPDEFDE